MPKFIEWKPREEVHEIVRGSLVPKFWKFLFLIVWMLIPFFLLFPLWRIGMVGAFVFFVLLLSGLVLLGQAYFVWLRTVFVITDCRIIDHNQKGFFHREVTEARYDQMDEVSYYIKGVFPTIFRYGNLKLQLQGASADIQVDCVSRPQRLTDLINDMRSNVRLKREHAIS